MTGDEKTPMDDLVDHAADLFVYAPIGLFFEGPSLLPKLAEQGRVHARNARMFGQFAVRHGEAEVRRRIGDVEGQAVGVLRLLGLVPDGDAGRDDTHAAPPARPVAVVPDGADVGTNGDAPAPAGSAPVDDGPAADELAITDYESLSASQVVTRLEGLTEDELEAVRAYETAHRGRKTILNKVAQLQA